jgi:capsular polysaccharide biosynthesis protein
LSQYDINFREYWRILKKRKALVTFVTIVLSIFITFFVYFRAPTPLYTTSCLIEFERAPALNKFYERYDPSAADDIETQITMVKSYPVFEKVVENLGLVPQKDMKENGHLNDQVITTIENLQAKVEVFREGVSAILMIKMTDGGIPFSLKSLRTPLRWLTGKHTQSSRQEGIGNN